MVMITREAAVGLFTALGITTAAKWNVKRIAAKLSKIDEMVDEDTTLEGPDQDTLKKVLGAIEDGVEISLGSSKEDDEPMEEPLADEIVCEAILAAGEHPKDNGKAKGKPVAKPEPEEKFEDKAVAKSGPKATRKYKKSGIVGIRESTKARGFFAGVIIKKRGIGAGVTDEMVAELDELYGRTNPRESLFALRNAWHAVRGYAAGI